MAQIAPINLGFLTILHEANGYLGGYLVTNTWGRPLEFRLSTAVQPNRVHHILYADTLRPYLCADLIGRALVEKATVPVQLVVTDTEDVLDLRHRIETPVVWVASASDEEALAEAGGEHCVLQAKGNRGPVFVHARHVADVAVVRETMQELDGLVDLTEPFQRIREAIAEARKAGVTTRAA